MDTFKHNNDTKLRFSLIEIAAHSPHTHGEGGVVKAAEAWFNWIVQGEKNSKPQSAPAKKPTRAKR